MAAYEVLLLNTAIPQIQAAQSGDTYVVPRAIAFNAGVNVVNNDMTVYGVTVGRGAGAVSTNTAVGASALSTNSTGANNVAIGYESLKVNTASNNTAVGYQAGYYNTTGSLNVFVGNAAGINGQTISNTVAIGNNTISSNGSFSTTTKTVAVGDQALRYLSSGSYNTALGAESLYNNTTASSNTAVGYQAGYTNQTGVSNTFLGQGAGYNSAGNGGVGSNTFVGTAAGYDITTGTKNTIIGRYQGNSGGLDIRTLSNYIVLSDGDGNPVGYHDATNWYFPSVDTQTTGDAANVNVGTNGVLRKSTSSLKYKRDVQNATHGLTEVLQLRSVTYKSKSALDGETVYGGLIAEEVEAAGLSEFVMYAADGTPDALAYGNMVSLCIKAIQELKAEVDILKSQLKGA